jgi:hypothetical protein
MFISGCTSVASSTAALMVALHSKKIEKDTRRYKGIDSCHISGQPVAYDIGYDIFNNNFFKNGTEIILSPEQDEKIENSRTELAYAYFYISQRMGDERSEKYIDVIQIQEDKESIRDIEEFVNYKYLQSYLTKCFSVPAKYKIRLNDRELIDSY